MLPDNDYIFISALQHFLFCQRQCALIHIEQLWEENYFTAAGRVMHEHVHEQGNETRSEKRIERALPLASERLGLSGKSDVVEFSRTGDGKLIVFPIEYKRGKPKVDDCDLVQLCAQALCLEEMTGTEILKGAVFYGKTWHRYDVEFDFALREKTENTVLAVRDLIKKGITPPPVYERRKCRACSLTDVCIPERMGKKFSVERYLSDGSKETMI